MDLDQIKSMSNEMMESQINSHQKAEASPSEEAAKKAIIEGDLDFLSNVPLVVSVELGQAEMSLRELMQVQKGSVIPLEKLAGEPLEFNINNRHVARGEVVVINERYGIRLTDIVNFNTVDTDRKG